MILSWGVSTKLEDPCQLEDPEHLQYSLHGAPVVLLLRGGDLTLAGYGGDCVVIEQEERDVVRHDGWDEVGESQI